MGRICVVTGSASRIGAATASLLRHQGFRVIGSDLHDADVVGDLTTTDGRAALIEGASRLTGGRIDAVVANAGGGPPETSLSLNSPWRPSKGSVRLWRIARRRAR
jgi:NAD(P)-dependent dehydrogenase (short-subunit alcohol dehydrogenase family)